MDSTDVEHLHHCRIAITFHVPEGPCTMALAVVKEVSAKVVL